jgi:hypothetical protein
MAFDLTNLIEPCEDLNSLAVPFQEAEIDNIVRKMTPDKSPGPDGFNGHFMKRCWQLIKANFYKLYADFNVGQADLESINDSLITLVTKKMNPEIVSDYRPISLLNVSLKILTKLLADRLLCKSCSSYTGISMVLSKVVRYKTA